MQFGKALNQILQRIQAANLRYGPVYMSKINVANAFHRINLNPADSIRMGVLFSSKKGERKLIGFPLVLPMGWAESPPAFCAGTETIADRANATLTTNIRSLDVPHRLDVLSETSYPARIGTKIADTSKTLKKILNVLSETMDPTKDDSVPELVRYPDPEFLQDPKFVPRSEIFHYQNPVLVSRTDSVPKSKGALKTDLDFPPKIFLDPLSGSV